VTETARHGRGALAALTLCLAACSSNGGDSAPGADGGPPADATGGAPALDPDAAGAQDATAAGGSPVDAGTPSDGAPVSELGPPIDAAPTPDVARGDPDVLVGAFQVLLTPAAAATAITPEVFAQTSIFGRVQDGPTPELVRWTEVAADGGCRLLTPSVPFCETPCGGSAACVDDDVCQPYPTALDVGPVTVTGLEASPGETVFTVEAVASNYQRSGLPYPPFDEGTPVQFDAAGGPSGVGPFSLAATGIATLSLTSPPLELVAGAAGTLTWTPPAMTGRSEVLVRLDISHHGGSNGKIECEVQDTGSLTLPASLLDALRSLGAAGFPTVIVTRRASGSAVIAPGRVDLWLLSTVEQAVVIPGLTSCTADEDCPAGTTCQPDLQCQ
jgi:hypothetical protein